MILIPRLTLLKPHGALVDSDTGREFADLLQCCHCQYTWQVAPGSGRRRGFCYRCNAVTCGKAECMVCVPFKAQAGE